MDDLVSVIIPVYNIEKFINRCIDSILQQSYKNLEIILVNDGSTDSSLKICEEYKKIDRRINVLDKPNGGLSDARNFGIKHSSGDYIVFVDGDDTVEIDYILKLYLSIKMFDSDLSMCSFNLVDENYHKYKEEILPLSTGLVDGIEILQEVLSSYGYVYVVSWNKMYKREIFDYLCFEKGKLYEDEYLNHHLFWSFRRVSIVKDCLYNYVQRSGSIIQSDMTIEKLKMKHDLHKRRIDFYKDKNSLLYNKSKQIYCNWLISCISEYDNLISKQLLKEIQKEYRQVCSSIELSGAYGWKKYLFYVQNYLAKKNVKLTARIKKILKEIKNG